MTDINEDLRKWFKEKWVRFDTKGNIKGDCAKEPGEGKPKCLPMAKAHALGKEKRAAAARRKRRQDPNAERKGKAKFVKTHNEEVLLEKNVPTNPKLWAQAKAQAKKKFKIYPSAYANGWASKWYKSKGGGWKSLNEDYEHEMARNELRTAMRGIERLMKHLDGEGELEAWVQSKLTKAADYIDTLADYMDSRDETVKEAYELIEEAKKKMDKRIPQTVQNLTPGSNPYADDSNCPTYVATPGNPITEESLKAKYKKLMKSRKPGVREQRKQLRDLAKQRAAAAAKRKELAKQATEKRQKELYPGPKSTGKSESKPKAPAKQMVPPMKGENTPAERIATAFNRPGYTSKKETPMSQEPTFQDALNRAESALKKHLYAEPEDKGYDHKKGEHLLNRFLDFAEAEYRSTGNKGILDDMRRYRTLHSNLKRTSMNKPSNGLVRRVLRTIGLREEHGAGDTGTTELTNKYIEHTPGQLPLGTTKVKKKITDTIKEVVAEQVLSEKSGLGRSSGSISATPRQAIRNVKRPPGSRTGNINPSRAGRFRATGMRGPVAPRKLRPGTTVSRALTHTAKFTAQATKRRRSVQTQMRSKQRARQRLASAARG